MTVGKLIGLVFAAIAFSIVIANFAFAQATGAPPSRKDCQTIRTCNFARDADVRGCLSSYSCRTCRFVRRCQSISGQRICNYQSECGWRGADS